MPASKWIGAATRKMKQKGTEGSFRRIASRMGESTAEAADTITAHPDKYSKKTREKAQFAKNVRK